MLHFPSQQLLADGWMPASAAAMDLMAKLGDSLTVCEQTDKRWQLKGKMTFFPADEIFKGLICKVSYRSHLGK
eukprot:1140281-Pelagomonas_calceolata.AAC.3